MPRLTDSPRCHILLQLRRTTLKALCSWRVLRPLFFPQPHEHSANSALSEPGNSSSVTSKTNKPIADGAIPSKTGLIRVVRMTITFRRGSSLRSQDFYKVKGHPFGLWLSDDDRNALIAFLKTL